MKEYQKQNLEHKRVEEEKRKNALKENLALKFHYLRSTKSIKGVYNRKILAGDLHSENPTIDGMPVDTFLKSTFKVTLFPIKNIYCQIYNLESRLFSFFEKKFRVIPNL